MSHSQFHCTGRAYLDMHGLIFETSICYWQDQPGRSASEAERERERDGGEREREREREPREPDRGRGVGRARPSACGEETRKAPRSRGSETPATRPPTPPFTHRPIKRNAPPPTIFSFLSSLRFPGRASFPFPPPPSPPLLWRRRAKKRPRVRNGGGKEGETGQSKRPAGSEGPPERDRGDDTREGGRTGKPPADTRGSGRRDAKNPKHVRPAPAITPAHAETQYAVG